MREEVGLIRVKDKLCLFIDGVTADKLGYVKSDLLRVDVVKVIADSFKAAGLPVMSVDELLNAIKTDNAVWDLYANGWTQGLNQCERPASTEKIKTFKPKNIVELCAFVAAIRPGFKSMLQTFITRTPFQYHINALDELLRIDGMTGNSAISSFLLFDEQILKLMIAGGIPAAEAYSTVKAIKKKKRDKVLAEKEKFLAGFSAYLQEKENADSSLATDVSEKVWKIIEDSSSYLFCCAHAFAYACDSAYGAWLKAHYPYEFYVTMLKLYTEKCDKDKIVAIINEMKRYKQIKLIPGQWKQDNRDWTVDKENNTISQSLSSIKFISQQTAESLYDLSQQNTFWIGTEYKKTKEKDSEGNFIYEETSFTSSFNTFTDVLRAIQMNTGIKKNEIEILIGIGYFKEYGGNGKLLSVFNEFTEGKNKLTKTIKSFNKRLDYLRNYEASLPDAYIDIAQQLLIENDNIGLCLSIFPKAPGRIYFVQEVDDKYGIKVKLYNIHNGNIGVIRIRKNTWAKIPLSVNQCIYIDDYSQEQRYSYKEGRRTPINGEYDIWANVYHILKQEDLKINEI